MIYTVTLNPSVDYTAHTDAFHFGEVNRSERESVTIGGKGINVSLVLKNLGISSCALLFTAGFTGDFIIGELKKKQIEVKAISLKAGFSRINFKLKTKSEQGFTETEVNGAGPFIGKEEKEAFLRELSALRDGDILVLAGSIPASLPKTFYAEILEQIKGKKLKCVTDAEGEALRSVLPCHPFLVKPNQKELENLFHVSLKTKDDIVKYAKKLQDWGAENVVVSLAEQGAILLTKEQEVFFCAPHRGTVKNSVGAGDSMVAGMLYGIEKGKSLKEALKIGNATGGATAFSETLATKEKVENLLKQSLL